MRIIQAAVIKEKIKRLAVQANTKIRPDVLAAVESALKDEKKTLARRALTAIIENSVIARRKRLALCQDTGLPVVFVEIGCLVHVDGNLPEIINKAVVEGYAAGYFRASVQKDVLWRAAKPAYGPAVIHLEAVKGGKLKITLLPKGFGAENKSAVKMFNPTAAPQDIENFVVETVRRAGAGACPPYVIGIGLGGTQDTAALTAKKALLRRLSERNRQAEIAAMEMRLLRRINRLGIGPMGLGGKTTALAVNIETLPTHIAGLPAAVNISCHALRSASAVL